MTAFIPYICVAYPRSADPNQALMGLCFKFQIQLGGSGTLLQLDSANLPGLKSKSSSYLEKVLLLV